MALFAVTSGSLQKRSNTNLIERLSDMKEFKKMLRTRSNVLVLFAYENGKNTN